jgi:hypothetical protein
VCAKSASRLAYKVPSDSRRPRIRNTEEARNGMMARLAKCGTT